MQKIMIHPVLKKPETAPVVPKGTSFIIDTREIVTPQIEKFFLTNFGQDLKTDNRIRSERLEIGDLLFKWNDQEVILIERKTLPDLMSSIKSDGRYREQKKRLLAARLENPGLRIYYLIEGQLGTRPKDRYFSENDRKIAYGATVNTLVRDGIPVIRTESLPDTLRTLGKMWELLQKEGKKLVTIAPALAPASAPAPAPASALAPTDTLENRCEYLIPVKVKKGENMNEAWCYLAMLQQIPGVSEAVAQALSSKYSDLPSLIAAYQSFSNPEECKSMLAEMPLLKRKLTATGRTRTVGPVVSERIWRYLGSPKSP